MIKTNNEEEKCVVLLTKDEYLFIKKVIFSFERVEFCTNILFNEFLKKIDKRNRSKLKAFHKKAPKV